MIGWDGTERRQAMLADERTRANGSAVEVPLSIVVIGFAAVILLQSVSLFHHFFLSADHNNQTRVDTSFVCYVVKTSQGQPVNVDLLTDCGFIPRIKGVGN
jgi:hypothetical protein